MNSASIPTYNNSDFETVLKRLNPARNRACNNNLLWGLGNGDFSGDYYGTSLKRSQLDCGEKVLHPDGIKNHH